MKRRIIQVKRIWWLTGLSFVICLLSFSPIGAQSTYTQKIQKSAKGEGQVTVTHDKAIDQLVNGTPQTTPVQPKKTTEEQTAKTEKPEKPATAEKAEKPDQNELTDQIDNRRKVMAGGYKVNGYRVQAFAGGNQRKDRVKAEQVGNTIKANYPGEPIYVHFYSPRWICRVGNYHTYEEAYQMLLNIRKLGISGASIVKGKITVQY